MGKQKLEIEADVPDGWVAVGFRCPEAGEHYLGDGGKVAQTTVDLIRLKRLILEKAPPTYRDVTDGDAGEKIEVRDGTSEDWREAVYIGRDENEFVAREREHGYSRWAFARIACDGKPRWAPIDGWVNVYERSTSLLHPTKEEADSAAETRRLRCARVREVTE